MPAGGRDGRHPIEERMTNPGNATRVLVVDDEPPIRAIVRGFLEREGMIVAEAADGPSAVEQVRGFAPDVVVLDIMLPGFDGLEVLRRVRTFADPLVIFLTARTEDDRPDRRPQGRRRRLPDQALLARRARRQGRGARATTASGTATRARAT